jgi:hypothetical protein
MVVPELTLLPGTLEANGFAEEEKDGDRLLVLSRSASDQLNPSPLQESVSAEPNALARARDGEIKIGDCAMIEDVIRLRLLPEVLAATPDEGMVFSSTLERYWEEGRLPPPDAPILLPALSRRACAPKLIRRPREGDAGVFRGTCILSSSSITAGSSPKLFRNSGEPEPLEVEMLARLCLANALYGELLLPPARPSVVMDMPRLCAGAGTEDVTGVELGEVGTAEEDTLRGLNSSANEERRP